MLKLIVTAAWSFDAVQVGIGTTAPQKKLDVRGESQLLGSTTVGTPGDGNTLLHFNTERSWVFRQLGTGASTALELAVANSGNANKNFVINTSGNVGIGNITPTRPLHMASGAHVTDEGVWMNVSSRSLKENISDLTVDEAFDALDKLVPVKFNYKRQKEEDYVGFIAEDVPDLVATRDRTSLSAMDIVAVLARVVQNQEERITTLNKQVADMDLLKKEVAEMRLLLKGKVAE